MRTYTTVYESVLSFHLLPVDEINRAKSVFVQIFSTYGSYATAEKIADEARIFFPDATIVGLSAFETIHPREARENKTLIAITCFDTVKLTAVAQRNIVEEKSFETGAQMAKKSVRKDTRLLLLYTDGLHTCTETLVEGIRSVALEVPVAGLLAADGGKFYDTYLLHGESTLDNGAVLVAFNSQQLQVSMHRYGEMECFGPSFHIEKSEGCTVHKIDGLPPAKLWCRYLGDAFVDDFPRAALDVALVGEQKGTTVARTPTKISEDGSMRFAGTLPPETMWRFGRVKVPRHYRFCPPSSRSETIFLFADAAQALHKNLTLHDEVLVLSDIATTVGAHGFGQIITLDGQTHVNNQSMVAVAMSEVSPLEEDADQCVELRHSSDDVPPRIARMLSHIGTVMLKESELLQNALSLLMKEFDEGLLVYDEELRLQLANEKAEKLLGIPARMGESKDLRLLDEWTAALLAKGLQEKVYVQIGKVIDPLTGESVRIRLTTMPVKVKGRIKGAIAFITEA